MTAAEEVLAIRGWIRERLAQGWPDERIARVLPDAALFVTGRIDAAEMRARLEVTR